MPQITGENETISFQVFCAVCEWPMCGEVVVEAPTPDVPYATLRAMPCPRCLGNTAGEAHGSGYRHGIQAGEQRLRRKIYLGQAENMRAQQRQAETAAAATAKAKARARRARSR
jgi:hypothetical protein